MKRHFLHLTAAILILILGNVYAQGISGVYSTDFNKMTLYQDGNKITGTYEYAGGKIEGTLNGTTLEGWWYQTNGKGRLRFTFNSDFTEFTGKWSYDNNEPSSGWNGKRTGTAPALGKDKQATDDPDILNISGLYTTDFNDMLLVQVGSKVTGTYQYADGRVEGTLSGNILKGMWYQNNGKGRFEFVFDSDAGAFKGKWGYDDAALSGHWDGRKK
jgi:hypothetical protein